MSLRETKSKRGKTLKKVKSKKSKGWTKKKLEGHIYDTKIMPDGRMLIRDRIGNYYPIEQAKTLNEINWKIRADVHIAQDWARDDVNYLPWKEDYEGLRDTSWESYIKTTDYRDNIRWYLKFQQKYDKSHAEKLVALLFTKKKKKKVKVKKKKKK